MKQSLTTPHSCIGVGRRQCRSQETHLASEQSDGGLCDQNYFCLLLSSVSLGGS